MELRDSDGFCARRKGAYIPAKNAGTHAPPANGVDA